FESIFLNWSIPRHLAVALFRCKFYGLCLEFGVCLCDRYRTLSCLLHTVGSHVVCRCESPRTIDDHANSNAERFGVDDSLHFILACADKLIEISANPYISIGSGIGLRSVERHIGARL